MWWPGVVALALVSLAVASHTPDEWKSRSIYQLLTDRFATADGSTPGCSLSGYCGGKWSGITKHLDYIKGMGFDAIWISPVVKNTEGGYHGYWMQDMYAVNPYFGDEKELKDLIKACHDQDVWVMVDVVANHVGQVGYDYSSINPFNSSVYYHDCNGCPSNCEIKDYTDEPQTEHCRTAGLPDLNQSDTFVSSQLNSWISELMTTYDFDGVRIDTVPEVSKDFWPLFQNAIGAYAVGEVYDSRVSFVSGYQGCLDGVLSYPMFFTLRNVFQYTGSSMYDIQSQFEAYQSSFKDLDLLGNFIDNHDQNRFLNGQSDTWLYKNAIVYTLMAQGIPIIYYGTEQGFNGGKDPANRELLWSTGFNNQTDLYSYIRNVINFRKQVEAWAYPQVQRYADNHFYAFTRGDTFVALTNGGYGQGSLTRTITYHPYSNGTKLCDIFWPNDCVAVTNGKFDVTLLHGEAKIFTPK
eukprot:TRINITY_DN5695_c0_g1_i4.p1 TRINITY_DN5695_c0_g1~~TRINITY_DN5695_c0_g1_i4.p1  ORF type:complete len:465 (-),score=111.83 TRINITY_DN5695_c0_g1_i4:1092-2486(-)